MVFPGHRIDSMAKSKLWKLVISVICGVVISPFVGTLASNIFIPYARSDSEISTVFEVSTVIAFPILVATIFVLLQRFFKEGTNFKKKPEGNRNLYRGSLR